MVITATGAAAAPTGSWVESSDSCWDIKDSPNHLELTVVSSLELLTYGSIKKHSIGI